MKSAALALALGMAAVAASEISAQENLLPIPPTTTATLKKLPHFRKCKKRWRRFCVMMN